MHVNTKGVWSKHTYTIHHELKRMAMTPLPTRIHTHQLTIVCYQHGTCIHPTTLQFRFTWYTLCYEYGQSRTLWSATSIITDSTIYNKKLDFFFILQGSIKLSQRFGCTESIYQLPINHTEVYTCIITITFLKRVILGLPRAFWLGLT